MHNLLRTVRGPPTTGTVRSIARLASQGMGVAANSNPPTDGVTSPKPASKAKTNAAQNPNPAAKTPKPSGIVGSRHTGAGAGGDGDGAPTSKKPVGADTGDGEDAVTFHLASVVRTS